MMDRFCFFLRNVGIVFVVCGCILTGVVWHGYRKDAGRYSDLRREYIRISPEREDLSPETDQAKEQPEDFLPASDTDEMCIDWDGLYRINSDLAAWLFVPDLDISYPVVQTEDPAAYLHTSFNGESSYAGTLFFDRICGASDLSGRLRIIYGHNMRDNSMFGRLKEWEQLSRSEMEKKQMRLYFPDRSCIYRVKTVQRIPVSDARDLRQTDFLPDVSEHKELLFLVTCTSDPSERLIVAGETDFT